MGVLSMLLLVGVVRYVTGAQVFDSNLMSNRSFWIAATLIALASAAAAGVALRKLGKSYAAEATQDIVCCEEQTFLGSTKGGDEEEQVSSLDVRLVSDYLHSVIVSQ
mmetsp:Transcript_12970/g.34946  ORF Transcript_12970/g.34946 Transcript_12970/m.34946 type:complete len:107 (-) Transcript_12970:25-345(-)